MSMTQRAWQTLPAPAKNAAKAVWSGYAWLTSRGRVLPDFLIIGTQRGGTTSLYKYLVQHPNLSHALTKEIRFFDLNYHRGLPWYRSRFPSHRRREMSERRRGAKLMVGEASPDYLFHPLAAARVAHDLPQARLIVLLRNPIDRAFSHYWHQFKRGQETLTFAAAIDGETDRLAGEVDKILADPSYVSYERHHHSYLARGIYVDQLAAWMELIPRDRFLIERSEDLFQDPRAVFRRVLEFLGLPDHDLTEYETFNAFSSGEMEPALRAKLVEYFRPHNQRLEAMLGRALGWDA
jgi:sulfotransferase family protein